MFNRPLFLYTATEEGNGTNFNDIKHESGVQINPRVTFHELFRDI